MRASVTSWIRRLNGVSLVCSLILCMHSKQETPKMLIPYDSDPLFSPFLYLLLRSHVFAISKLNLNELGTVGCHLAGNSGNKNVLSP